MFKFSKESHWPLTLFSTLTAILNMAIPILMSRRMDIIDVADFRLLFLYLANISPFLFLSGLSNGIFYFGSIPSGLQNLRAIFSMLFLETLAAFSTVVYLEWTSISTSFWPFRAQFTSLFILLIPPTLFQFFLEFSLITRKRIFLSAVINFIFDFIRAVIVIFQILQQKHLDSILWTYIILGYLKLIGTYIIGVNHGFISKFLIDLKALKEQSQSILKYALPIGLASFFDVLLNSSDKLLLSRLISSEQFAIYAVGCLLIPPLQSLETSVNKVLLPQLTQNINNPEKIAQLYQESTRELLSFHIPAFFGLFTFANEIILLLFGEKFQESGNVLRLFSFTYLFQAFAHDVIPRSQGHSRFILRTNTFFGALSALSTLFGAWYFGPFGALGGMLLSQFLWKFYAIQFYVNQLRLTWRKILPIHPLKKYVKICVLLSLMGYGTQTLFAQTSYYWPWGFLAIILAYAIIYLVWLKKTMAQKK